MTVKESFSKIKQVISDEWKGLFDHDRSASLQNIVKNNYHSGVNGLINGSLTFKYLVEESTIRDAPNALFYFLTLGYMSQDMLEGFNRMREKSLSGEVHKSPLVQPLRSVSPLVFSYGIARASVGLVQSVHGFVEGDQEQFYQGLEQVVHGGACISSTIATMHKKYDDDQNGHRIRRKQLREQLTNQLKPTPQY